MIKIHTGYCLHDKTSFTQANVAKITFLLFPQILECAEWWRKSFFLIVKVFFKRDKVCLKNVFLKLNMQELFIDYFSMD